MNAIVIGAGPDELVAAHLLARAGHHVTVLREYSSPDLDDGWVMPSIVRELEVGGFETHQPDPWLRTPLPDGGTLELRRDMGRSVESIRRVSPHDAQQWPAFAERMGAVAALLERIYSGPAPGLVDLRFALKIRSLGRRGMEDLMRWLPMPVAELLDDWFECDALKGALAALALRNLQQGPRSAGTALHLLHFHAGNPPGVLRPPHSNISERLRALPGLQARESKVARITVRAGRTAGVVLESGEELPASLVVSGADPKRTLADLVEPGWLDPELVRATRNVRNRGVAAKLVVEHRSNFDTLTIAPSLDYVERAYDDAKYGRVSAQPFVDVTANEMHVQYAPHGCGTHDEVRERAVATLGSQLGPVEITEVLLPADLEQRFGWPEGQPHQAELTLDQALWMRPLPELARYSTPIEGLWLCGPAMHPGAGVVAASGYNCAKQILSKLRA